MGFREGLLPILAILSSLPQKERQSLVLPARCPTAIQLVRQRQGNRNRVNCWNPSSAWVDQVQIPFLTLQGSPSTVIMTLVCVCQEQVRKRKIAFFISYSADRFLTSIGLQGLAMPLSNTTAITIALVSDAMDVLLPWISDLVKGTGLRILALI